MEKSSLKTRLRWLFLIAGVIFFFLSCSKANRCETWEYYDECEAKTFNGCDTGPFHIYGTHFHDYLCGSELDGIAPGYTVVRTDDGEKKVTRHYVKKINWSSLFTSESPSDNKKKCPWEISNVSVERKWWMVTDERRKVSNLYPLSFLNYYYVKNDYSGCSV